MNLQVFLFKVKELRIAEQQLEKLQREGTSKENLYQFRGVVIRRQADVDKMIRDIEKNLFPSKDIN